MVFVLRDRHGPCGVRDSILSACRLSGCVPIPPQNHALLTYNSTNTLITGSCPTQRLEVEAQQRKALDLLPAVFYADTESNASSWQLYMTQTLKQYPTLSGLYGEGKLGSAPMFTFLDPNQVEAVWIEVQFESINGAFCITEMYSYPLGVATPALLKLLPQLPYLRSFRAKWSGRNGGVLCQQPFPTQLAAIAPASLQVFELSGMQLCCSLPEAWSSWSTVVELKIQGNALVTGPLPNWTGMKSLKSLDLSDNDLTSTLPASFGTAAWSKYVQSIDMHANERLSGTVPSTWSALSAKEIDLEMTNITGCVPDQLINAVEPFHKFFRCSRKNTELLALKALKGLFEDDGSTLQSWQEDPSDFVPDPLKGNSCFSTAALSYVVTVHRSCEGYL